MLRRAAAVRHSFSLATPRRSQPSSIVPFARSSVVTRPFPVNALPHRAQHTAQAPFASAQIAQPWQIKKDEATFKTDAMSKASKTTKDKDQRISMNISHDEQKRRFSMRVEGATNAEAAFLEYDVVHPGVWDIKYTKVAREYQHHGIADELVTRALETAQSMNVKVTCSCSYVSDTYMPRHPEWNKIRTDQGQSSEQQSQTKNDQSKASLERNEKLKSSDRVRKAEMSGEMLEERERIKNEAKRPAERAANEINEAMTKSNERGFRGYA